MPIQYSVGAGGVNRADDTRYIQDLLNRQKTPAYTFGKIAVDGLVGPQTIGAISNYQQRVVKMAYPDGRVGYQTIACLESLVGGKPGGKTGPNKGGSNENEGPIPRLHVEYRYGARPGKGKYESEASFSGPDLARVVYPGSIYPDDMNHYGRIADGSYPIQLGFHGRSGGTPDEEKDFVYKPNGGVPTPVLIVNRNRSVPIISDNPGIRTSGNIHIHRGWQGERGSAGCLTIAPPNWEPVFKMLLKVYPNFSDWTSDEDMFLGKECGRLVVGPKMGSNRAASR
jgi:hypothetical protein